jgi:anti-sigma factor RsiW
MFIERVIALRCSDEVIQLMHEYLDEEISPANEKKLFDHLNSCTDCHVYFQQLNDAVAFIQKSTTNIQAPENFTASVMAKLPQEGKKMRLTGWMKVHPFLTAASLFFVLMAASLISSWQKDQAFSVTNQANLIVQGNKVIVPKGEVVKGDIIVKNGELTIEGEVQGDVTVINGEHYLASAGHVTGDIEEINKVFDWLWYQMKKTGQDVLEVFNK